MEDLTYKVNKEVYRVDKGISDKYDLPKDKSLITKNIKVSSILRGINYVIGCNPDSTFYGIYGSTPGGEIKPVGVITEENAQLIKDSTVNHFPNYAHLPPIDYYLEISKKGHNYFSKFHSLIKVKCSFEEARQLYDSILDQCKN
jgi:hypothetical protein